MQVRFPKILTSYNIALKGYVNTKYKYLRLPYDQTSKRTAALGKSRLGDSKGLVQGHLEPERLLRVSVPRPRTPAVCSPSLRVRMPGRSTPEAWWPQSARGTSTDQPRDRTQVVPETHRQGRGCLLYTSDAADEDSPV